jgi:N-methylhydantoinase A/oxoprolinase/acetone carboxylase beta subunit
VSVRIGVDVGGTFTKAVACRSHSGEIVARSVVPTTHGSMQGVAEGVVTAVRAVTEQVQRQGLGPILLVSHSTTQAVNALLEGDTSIVGILGIGRRPDLRRARRRTEVGHVRLAPGRTLHTRHAFLDASDGLDRSQVVAAIRGLIDEGAEVLCVSEAFGVEDARGEWLAMEVASDLGIPACAGHELTGLYGLEMRTVTGALNAGILPTALRTARLVEEAVAEDCGDVPVLVMRGDGGAADLGAMKRHPLVTAFSGPAASVAGALRHLAVHDGIVVEVGGTSTNVSAVRGGRPVLSYVRVLDHVTCVRSIDVRVVGVAGGSLLRVGKRLGRFRLEDVGPRSAHIAGLPYGTFASPDELDGATARLISPRPGDPEEYLVLETREGRRFAPTLTCAANAAGLIADGSYATGDGDSARRSFAILGAFLGCDPGALARSVVGLAVQKVAGVVTETMGEYDLSRPRIIGLGGGAGALVPALADAVGGGWNIPPNAEVISSVGDALSIVRVEIERTMAKPSAEAVAEIHREAERAAVAAGAAPSMLQLESKAVPERGALRVAAFGSVALEADAIADQRAADQSTLELAAKTELGEAGEVVFRNDCYSVYVAGDDERRRFAIFDRHGSLAATGTGVVLVGRGSEVGATLDERMPKLVRHYGPVAVAPALRILRGTRLVDLSLFSSPDKALEASLAECALGHDSEIVAFVSRD